MTIKPKPIDAALRKQIEKSGVTVYALAALADVTPQSLGRFVKGERYITLKTATKLAQALGLVLVPAVTSTEK
jgi:plasmid maintenance system antidote protein VapI